MAFTEMLVMMMMFLMYVAIAALLVFWRLRVSALRHEERMRALELRMPLPPDSRQLHSNPYLWPLASLGVGLGTTLAGKFAFHNNVLGGIGLILLFLGTVLLLAQRMNRENRRRAEEAAMQQSETYANMLATAMRQTPPPPPVPPRATEATEQA